MPAVTCSAWLGVAGRIGEDSMNTKTKNALDAARHELTTLHGLLAADGAAPSETWTINVADTLALIDAALASESSEKNSLPS